MSAPARSRLLDARVMVRGLVLIATLAVIGAAFERFGLRHLLAPHWVDAQVRGKGWAGEVLFVAVAALFTAVGLPRQVPSFLAGYALGFVHGTVLGLAITVLGAAATFYYGRFMGRDFLLARFPGAMRKIDDFLAGHALLTAVVLRLSPFTSNLVTNLAAGVSGVRLMPFFAGSALGYLPQTMIFALLGSGVSLDPALRMGGSVVMFVVSSVLGLWLWRRTRRSRGLPEDDGLSLNS